MLDSTGVNVKQRHMYEQMKAQAAADVGADGQRDTDSGASNFAQQTHTKASSSSNGGSAGAANELLQKYADKSIRRSIHREL